MCRPHCWQYAKPTGVGVPQRGHVIMLTDPEPGGGGNTPGAVEGMTPGAPSTPGGGPTGFVACGGGSGAGIGGAAICVGAMPGAPMPGAAMPGAP
jgi:hypothetical protein